MLRISKVELQTKHPHRKDLISKMESDWEQDPFVQPSVQDTTQMNSSASLLFETLNYSGYIFSKKMALAVINGYEYRTGEIINGYNYRIIHITPPKVILENNRGQVNIFFNEE